MSNPTDERRKAVLLRALPDSLAGEIARNIREADEAAGFVPAPREPTETNEVKVAVLRLRRSRFDPENVYVLEPKVASDPKYIDYLHLVTLSYDEFRRLFRLSIRRGRGMNVWITVEKIRRGKLT